MSYWWFLLVIPAFIGYASASIAWDIEKGIRANRAAREAKKNAEKVNLT